jgi:exopolysaccharide biosynthesis polyprenyl glycosylphosphotransferase
MAEENNKILIQASRLVDTALTALAFIVAYVIKDKFLPIAYRGVASSPHLSVIMLLTLTVWYIGFHYSGIFNYYSRKVPFLRLFADVFRVAVVNLLLMILAFYIFKLEDVSRLMIGIFFIINVLLLIGIRWIFAELLHRLRKSSLLNVLLVIGSKQAAKDLIASIQCDVEGNRQILGCLDLSDDDVGNEVAPGVNVIGTIEQFESTITSNVIDEVIFAMPVDMIKDAEKYFSIAEALGVRIRVVPHWYIRKFLVSRPDYYFLDFENFLENPTFVLSATPPQSVSLLVKTFIDYLLASVGVIILLPFFLCIAIAIKLCSPGPLFFKQVRCGLNGRKFELFKFRTMIVGAENMLPQLLSYNEANGPVFKMKNDPRIIPVVGTFLRKTYLDELPQLINVLRGEMSLIGPRPPIPEEVSKYMLWERRRLSMKPGMTGLWQIQPLRHDMTFEEWIKLDLQYMDDWSPWLDVKIFFKTMLVVLLGRGQ